MENRYGNFNFNEDKSIHEDGIYDIDYNCLMSNKVSSTNGSSRNNMSVMMLAMLMISKNVKKNK